MGVETRRRRLRPQGGHRPRGLPARGHACARATSSTPCSARCEEVEGVSAIIYIQTCAAEKRRRRKRGTFPDPDRRVFINPDVCEGCGDCGVQSNCVSILPLETEFGRKRDDRPVLVQQGLLLPRRLLPELRHPGGRQGPQGPRRADLALPELPEPTLPAIDGTYNIVITGVGGTGVVTVGALLAMAAHLEGKGAGEMEMAGLAQKGGAVHIHCRIAERPADISAIRVAVGEADALIGGDLVVSAGAKTLGLHGPRPHPRRRQRPRDHHRRVHPRPRASTLPTDRLTLALRARLGEDGLRDPRRHPARREAPRRRDLRQRADARRGLAGRAWCRCRRGGARSAPSRSTAPASRATSAAFAIGRWAIAHPARCRRRGRPAPPPPAEDLATIVARRAGASRRATRAAASPAATAPASPRPRRSTPSFAAAMAKGYHKLLDLQGRIRGRPPARRDAQGRGRCPASPTSAPCASTSRRPSSAAPTPSGRPQKQRVRPVDAARLRRSCSGFKLPARNRLRSLRLHRRAPDGARADRRVRARHGRGPRRPDRRATGDVAIELAALPLGDPRLRAGQGRGRGGSRRPPRAELRAAFAARRPRRPRCEAAE